ncbi:type II toxin-antitoxin system HicB family antitoxin [Bifidobacterium stellenboschense]|uniref:HicB family protein n=1 Tax=Bifidobacterium stellenboschense TaxID=762211 RepID=A0A087DNB3_9BIFI|nr:type II toxin-antitoxin system HicB family antitoxin [Bifidobacterium stellenboschense]KFI97013.1 HicB family protein [Bifidobacterium stellenboschense]
MSGNRKTESRKTAARADGAAVIAAQTAMATASDAGATAPANIPDVNHYAYRIRWDGKSERFVASCAELPDVTFESDSQLEAFVGIRNAAEAEVKRLAKAGEEAPEPLSERRFSGRILVRIPPELHRALTIEAAEQHISLNRLISNRLAG